jgi:hypothetical protein
MSETQDAAVDPAEEEKRNWVKQVFGIDPQTSPGKTDRRGPNVRLTQARLAWNNAKSAAAIGLHQVEKAILADIEGASYADEVKANLYRLHAVFDRLDTRLIDALDKALQQSDEQERKWLQAQAAGIVQEYLGYLRNDPVLAQIDDNPFVQVSISAELTKTLTDLAKELA